MLIYICNYISIFFWNLLIKNRRLFIAIISLQMFLILAIRDVSLGSDLINYSGGFEFIKSLSFTDVLSRLHLLKVADLVHPYSYESGYVLINKFISLLGGNFRFFLILYAAFCILSFARFISKYSSLPYLSFAMLATLGFYEYSFGILRQTLALCILLWAIPFIEKKKPLKFLLIVLLAFWVHRAAAIFLLLYPAARIKVSHKTFLFSYVFWMLLFIFIKPIYQYFLIPILDLIGKGRYTNVALAYNNQIVVMILLAVMVQLFANFKEFKKGSVLNIACMGYLLSVVVEILGMMNDGVARMVEFYFIFSIILIPNVLHSYKQKDQTLALVGQAVLYLLLFIFMIVTLSASEIVPYVPFWKGAAT